VSNKTTIARPYAKAAFEYALQHKQITPWAEMLACSATIVHDPAVSILFGDPRVTAKVLARFILDICGDPSLQSGEHFIHLLADNRRLNILPEIVILFEAYCAEHEKRVDVQVTSAFALSEQEKTQLEAALKTRLQREVSLQCGIDQNLLGGAVIRMGDQVIDGSVRGSLARLSAVL
jgi:F-type H+-transporting ATPase subunit delta